jgi:predicted ribosome quality control (RQC) complex YloA/Tae2 family protein
MSQRPSQKSHSRESSSEEPSSERDGRSLSIREEGVYHGKAVAKVFDSPDGYRILVGKSARDNDLLTFKLSRPNDFWLHVAAQSGSHVLVLNPDNQERLPRSTLELAAGLAAGYSGAVGGGLVDVHFCQVRDVQKGRGAPAGQVQVKRIRNVKARPRRDV